MKGNSTLLSRFIVAALLFIVNPVFGQGTQFTYQGRLNTNGTAFNGTVGLRFKLFSDQAGNTQVGSTFLTNNVGVSGGLFTAGVDFGAGIFTGSNYFLKVGVSTNGGASFTDLSPLQPVTPTPYAIMANGASNLLGKLATAQLNGTVGNGQLANSSVTVNTGGNLSGGGSISLGGSGMITDNGTSGNTPSTLVQRDSSGNFSAQTVSVFSGNAFTLNITNGPITFYPPFPGGSTTNVIILQDNQAIGFFGTNTPGAQAIATISLSAEHGSDPELRMISGGRASMVMGYGCGFQIGCPGCGPQDMYLANNANASQFVPTTPSFPLGFRPTLYDNGVEYGDFLQIYGLVLNTNYNLPGSGALRVTGFQLVPSPQDYLVSQNPTIDFISQVGTMTYGIAGFSKASMGVASGGVYWVNCIQNVQEAWLNGPVTVSLTNTYLLVETNSFTMNLRLYPGLAGNYPLSFVMPGVNMVWESELGPQVAPTNLPAGKIMHITATAEVDNGVTNLFLNYKVCNQTQSVGLVAKQVVTADSELAAPDATVRNQGVNATLLNEFQRKVEEQEKEIQELKRRLDQLEKRKIGPRA